jgi:cytochrome P450
VHSTEAFAASLAADFTTQNAAAKPFNDMPGPSKWPLIGILPTFLKYGVAKMPAFYDDIYKYGMICNASIMNEKIVALHDPREMLRIFQKEGKYPMSLVSDAWANKLWHDKRGLEYNSILKDGEAWRIGRHAMQKDLFSLQAASSYAPIISKTTTEVMSHFSDQVKAADGAPMRIEDFALNSVADVFTAAVLGESVGLMNAQVGADEQEWVDKAMRSIQLSAQLISSPQAKVLPSKLWREFDKDFGRTNELTENLVRRAIERYRDYTGPEDELPYVVRLHRRGDIREDALPTEVSGIVMAGLDTTFHVLLWNIINLAANPAAQQTLRDEVLRVLGPDAHFTREQRKDMHYMKAVIRETQRFTPAAPLLTFRMLEEDIALCGYNIPAGTKIWMVVEPLQADPRVVDEPQRFLPERFLPEAVEARKHDQLKSLLDHRLLSSPFSFGPRMCMGSRLAELEIMSLLAQLVAKFKFELAPEGQTWTKTMRTMSVPDRVPTMRFTQL